jgi:subtilisin family serine protease
MHYLVGTSSRVIYVANSDYDDALDSTSNRGELSVAIAAPGSSIMSTLPVSMGSYGIKSGTSAAVPHVSGAATLLLSVDPNLTAQQLKSITLKSVDVIQGLNGLVTTSGRLNVRCHLI